MDVLLPPWLSIARLNTQYRDNTGLTNALYTGAPETTGYGGDRLRLSLEFSPVGTSTTQQAMERAALRSFLARLRGRQNRAYLWDPSYRQRGSFPTGELLSNNTFANGTTGWTANANAVLSVSDRVARVTSNGAGAQPDMRRSSAVTVTQYAPYVLRAAVSAMRFDAPQIRSFFNDATLEYSSASLTTPGLATVAAVPMSASLTSVGAFYTPGTGHLQGTFFDVSYMSLSRCALVDNAGNTLVRSDEFDNASWTKSNATVSANADTAPDGTSTADRIVEDSTASSVHRVEQSFTVSASAAEFAFTVALKPNSRTWAAIQLSEDTGSTTLTAYFNLATGAVGTTAAGANWSNLRTFSVDLGNGWFRYTIIGRKTNGATTVRARIFLATADGVSVYSGDGASNIRAWRATLKVSSVPTHLVQTTATSQVSTAQTGSGTHVKGLPATTAGLLLPDDRFEVITDRGSEMKIVTASLDSDAAGLGYLQFEPPLIGAPADNAPIIVHNPMTRAIFAGEMVGWSDDPGIISSASAEFEEA